MASFYVRLVPEAEVAKANLYYFDESRSGVV